jgi:hypothetical protein
MSTKSRPKAKPRNKPAKPKGGRPAGKSPTKSKPGKAKAAKGTGRPARKAAGTGSAGGKVGTAGRLRPGELDGLVIAHMRERADALPLGPSAVAKGIGRSAGAVGNCLERLAKADASPVRRVTEKPRAYDLGSESAEAASGEAAD